MFGLYVDLLVNEDDRNYVDGVMLVVGKMFWVMEEDGINGVIVVVGSSLVYFFLFL